MISYCRKIIAIDCITYVGQERNNENSLSVILYQLEISWKNNIKERKPKALVNE